jgi:hypothetical protein
MVTLEQSETVRHLYCRKSPENIRNVTRIVVGEYYEFVYGIRQTSFILATPPTLSPTFYTTASKGLGFSRGTSFPCQISREVNRDLSKTSSICYEFNITTLMTFLLSHHFSEL